MNLEVTSENFHISLPSGIRVDRLDVLWAAITVGHRNPLFWQWYKDDQFGYQDLKSREHFVYANLDFSDYTSIKYSDWFDSSDPTEKRFVNYRIGMMFMKLVTHHLLNIPWLVHYSWMEKDGLTSVPGKSEPDLLGYNSFTGEWVSIEAKGRLAKLTTKEMADALKQAGQVESVDNSPVTKCLAGGTYRSGKSVKFLWKDPDAEGKLKLVTPVSVLRNYYAGAFKLYELQERDALKGAFDFRIELSAGLKDIRGLLNSKKEARFEDYRDILMDIQRDATLKKDTEGASKRAFLDGITLVGDRL